MSPAIVSVAVLRFVTAGMPLSVAGPGATVSTLHVDFVASLVSPLESVWVTWRVCWPSARPEPVNGLVHGTAVAPSSEQLNVEPAEPVKLALNELDDVASAGRPVTTGADGTMPTTATLAVVAFVVVPSPNCPESLRPAQRTVPAKVSWQVMKLPAARAVVPLKTDASTAVLLAVVPASPSSP